MSYSRRLKESLSLLYAAVERDWLERLFDPRGWVRIWEFRDDGILRTAKLTAAYMDVRGLLRTHFGAPNAALAKPVAPVAERPIAPGTSRVLCPPGTYAFRGHFLFRG